MGLLLTNPLKRTYIYHINTAFIGHPLLFLIQYVLQHLFSIYVLWVATFKLIRCSRATDYRHLLEN